MADVSHFNIKIAVDAKTGQVTVEQFGEKVKKTGRDIEKSAAGMGAGFSKIKLGIGVAAAALIAFSKSAMDAYGVQRRAEKELEATVRSTGGAAGLTANELKKMASELQAVTNFGDEATIKGQAMLLTFTNIGKDVFPAATEAMLNMAQKFGGGAEGMQTASIQLGKALNDPVQGVTALRRVGIQLSQQQQDQIKQFMAVNDIAGAQKVILGELDTQFGGLARAMASPMKQLKNLYGDMKEKFGELVMKIITPLIPVLSSIVEVFMQLADALLPVVKQLSGALVPVMKLLEGVVKQLLPPLVKIIEKIFVAAVPIIEKLAGALVRLIPSFVPLIDVLTQIIDENLDMLIPLLESMVDLLIALTPAIQLAVRVQADFLRIGMSIINAVVRPMVDAIKFIIEKGAEAASWIASIFGGDGDKKTKAKKLTSGGDGGGAPTGPQEGDILGDKIFLNGKWVPRKKGAGALNEGGGAAKEKTVVGSVPYLEEQIKKVEELRDKTVAGSTEWANYTLKIAALQGEMAIFKRLADDLSGRSPEAQGISAFEKIASDIALIPEAAAPAIDATVSLLDELASAYEQVADSVASVLGSMGELFNANFEEMKAISVAQAIISTAGGVAKALEQGGILGIAGAVTVGLAGAAQVKKIMETKPGSSGGSGGAPSGLAQAGSAPARAGGGAAPRRLNLASGAAGGGFPSEIKLVADGDSLVGVLQVNTRNRELAGV